MNKNEQTATMYENIPAVAELNKVPGFNPLKLDLILVDGHEQHALFSRQHHPLLCAGDPGIQKVPEWDAGAENAWGIPYLFNERSFKMNKNEQTAMGFSSVRSRKTCAS